MNHLTPFRPSGSPAPLSAGGVLAAVTLAAATGSGLTALLFASGTLLSSSGGGVAMAVSGLPLFFIFACPIWLAGLIAIGGPCWWMLHRLGVRSRWAAALAGALLTLSVAGGYVALSPSDSGSIEAWTFVAGLTAIGAIAGRVLAKVAYPRKAVR